MKQSINFGKSPKSMIKKPCGLPCRQTDKFNRMKRHITVWSFVSSLTLLLLFPACVDTQVDEVVDYKDYYSSVSDADASILGLYGKFMELAAPTVVLNELRGDYLDVTSNASKDLMEINQQSPSAGNQWIDVQKFYSVIQNCNDMLYNFDIMLKKNLLTTTQYNERYSDVGAIRCWVYYQLGVQFGKVPYITQPLVDFRDLEKYKDSEMDLDQLIPTLISFMENLPTLENYEVSNLVTGTVDGYSLIPYFINKKCFLGDLYLFNNQYEKAATIYRDVLAYGEDLAATDRSQYRKNRLYKDYVWYTSTGTVDYFSVLYPRYQTQDYSLMYNSWRSMFELSADVRGAREEMIWEMSYDYKYAPTYPFIELFGNKGKGKYYLKPSKYAIDELWGSEKQVNGFPYDCRGISGGVDVSPSGDYVVAKYLLNYDAANTPYQQTGKWFLYRAAMLHLRYAEAANRAGYPKLAWALVNDGIKGVAFNWKHADGTTYRADSIAQSSWGPGNNYPYPYYFDARDNSGTPYFKAPYRQAAGVRGRANLPNVSLEGITTLQDSIHFIEKMIVKEAGLELAFEGNRWTDLIRVARRLQKENGSGGEFLNEHLRPKYILAGKTAPDFSSSDKWYFAMPK